MKANIFECLVLKTMISGVLDMFVQYVFSKDGSIEPTSEVQGRPQRSPGLGATEGILALRSRCRAVHSTATLHHFVCHFSMWLRYSFLVACRRLRAVPSYRVPDTRISLRATEGFIYLGPQYHTKVVGVTACGDV